MSTYTIHTAEAPAADEGAPVTLTCACGWSETGLAGGSDRSCRDRARAVCGALGLDQPEPLADIDAILAESVVAAAGGDW